MYSPIAANPASAAARTRSSNGRERPRLKWLRIRSSGPRSEYPGKTASASAAAALMPHSPRSPVRHDRHAAATRLADQVASAGPPAVLARRDVLPGSGGQAAVDDQGVAADEPGVVAGQPQG